MYCAGSIAPVKNSGTIGTLRPINNNTYEHANPDDPNDVTGRQTPIAGRPNRLGYSRWNLSARGNGKGFAPPQFMLRL